MSSLESWIGDVAGLIPCPLTLCVMILAAAKGVALAGTTFAFMSMLGVAMVLGTVARAASTLGMGALALTPGAGLISRILLVATGLALLSVSAVALVS